MTNNGIILYPDMLEDAMSILSSDEFTELMKIIINYKKTGNVPKNMSKMMTLAFLPFKQTMDINQEKYNKKCQKNRENINRRWNNEEDTNEYERIQSYEKDTNEYERIQSNNSYTNDTNTNTNTNTDTNTDTDTNNKKENIKEKDPKIHFAEFVTMTNAEYEKLVSTYSKEFADQCIEVLDNYKGSSGKKYKSDYRAILTWVIDEVKKRKKAITKAKTSNFTSRSYENLNDLYVNTGQKVGKNE